jgi:hypothetical protein
MLQKYSQIIAKNIAYASFLRRLSTAYRFHGYRYTFAFGALYGWRIVGVLELSVRCDGGLRSHDSSVRRVMS